MTLTEVVDAYLTRQRSLGMRFESAGQLLHQFSRAMGNPKIGEVTPEAVADFLRGKGALSTTWLLRYKVLTGLYRFAIGRGYVGCSPLPRTLPKLPPQQTPYVYSTEELHRLVEATTSLRVGHSRSSAGYVPYAPLVAVRKWHAHWRGPSSDLAGRRSYRTGHHRSRHQVLQDPPRSDWAKAHPGTRCAYRAPSPAPNAIWECIVAVHDA